MATSKMQKTFNMMVLEHFGYLVGEYNFQVDKILHNDPDVLREGFVEYQSPTTFVSVAGEWYGMEVSFGRAIDDRTFSIYAELVHEFLSLTPEQRQIVCSRDPRHKKEARQLIASQQLQYEKREFANGADRREHELMHHACWLRQYADPFLRGDFSLWLPIHEYKLARMIGEVRQSWKREIRRRFVGLAEGWKAVHVREHMFQSDVDYLARLKAESSKERLKENCEQIGT
jgi:hypothetical protein